MKFNLSAKLFTKLQTEIRRSKFNQLPHIYCNIALVNKSPMRKLVMESPKCALTTITAIKKVPVGISTGTSTKYYKTDRSTIINSLTTCGV